MDSDKKSYSQYLAAHVEDLKKKAISEQLLEKFKMVFLDHLAAIFNTYGSDILKIASRTVSAYGPGPCLLLDTNQTASLMGAVFHNALIATAEDLDDIHPFASGLHLGATTFPAIIALAQNDSAPVSGEKFMRAAIAGYEVSSRIVRAADSGIRDRGLHSSGAAGAFGSCAASAVLLDISEEELVNAMGIASSTGSGLFAFLKEGSSVRHAHAAWAGVNGLGATLLGKAGMTGPRFAIEGYSPEGKDGWLGAYAGQWNPEYIMRPVETPEMLNAAHKLHAACGHAAPAILALQQLRQEAMQRRSEIASINIGGYKASAALNNPTPRTQMEAKFSLPFLSGIILLYGQATLREMTEENLANQEVWDIAKLVSVEADPELCEKFPKIRGGKVNITFTDGSVISRTVDAPQGMPANPVDLAVIKDKFINAAEGKLTKEQINHILDMTTYFENLRDVKVLIDALAVKPKN